MKKILLALLLASCGDNIHPIEPDARVWPKRDADPETAPGSDDADAGVPDSGIEVPDAGTCDDKHIELNGHEHKCQHNRK